jgi:hypothetical protein
MARDTDMLPHLKYNGIHLVAFYEDDILSFFLRYLNMQRLSDMKAGHEIIENCPV